MLKRILFIFIASLFLSCTKEQQFNNCMTEMSKQMNLNCLSKEERAEYENRKNQNILESQMERAHDKADKKRAIPQRVLGFSARRIHSDTVLLEFTVQWNNNPYNLCYSLYSSEFTPIRTETEARKIGTYSSELSTCYTHQIKDLWVKHEKLTVGSYYYLVVFKVEQHLDQIFYTGPVYIPGNGCPKCEKDE